MRIKAGRAWHATVHSVVGLPVALVTHVAAVVVGNLALVLAVTVVGLPYGLTALFSLTRDCSRWQRSRFAGLLGVDLAEPPPADPDPMTAARSAATWRPFWYHLIVGLLTAALGFSVVVGLWSAAAVFLLMAWRNQVRVPLELFGLPTIVVSVPPIVLMAVGLGCGLAAYKLAGPLAALDVRAARALLEPSRADLLEKRVRVLTESRSDAVSAADAERKRIERDLHDGAQQRLVSLAMKLGMARADLSEVDDRSRRVIEEAHDEAKQALAELRNLVRGLHPAVLEDRGLDAALSGIAARSPVPTRVTVDLPRRPSPTIEAVAYFVVSEALSNVAKHAGAREVSVEVRSDGQRLRVVIRDDGHGGASFDGGTGLRGLAQRVASVDGSLLVDSPVGGPTTITAELPCES